MWYYDIVERRTERRFPIFQFPQEVHTKPRRNGLATGRSFVAQCRILRYYEGRF